MKTSLSRFVQICALVMCALLMLSGCSGKTKSSGETVTLITHESFELPEALLAKFTEETGMKVEKISPGDAGTVVNQLVLADGKPGADVVFGIDTFSAGRALQGKILEDYVSPEVDKAAEPAISGSLTPVDRGDVCVNYDVAWFESHGVALPETVADLAKPEYAGLLVTENAAQSSPGLAFLAGTVKEMGADGAGTGNYVDWWKQAVAGGTRIAGGWTEAYYTDFSGSEGKGNYPLVVSYSSSPAAENGATKVLPKTCVKQVEYAGVLRGAANPEGAKKFIDFLLSDEVQKAIPDAMYVYPVKNVPLPTAWAEHAPKVDNPMEIDPETASTDSAAWLTAWREAVGM